MLSWFAQDLPSFKTVSPIAWKHLQLGTEQDDWASRNRLSSCVERLGPIFPLVFWGRTTGSFKIIISSMIPVHVKSCSVLIKAFYAQKPLYYQPQRNVCKRSMWILFWKIKSVTRLMLNCCTRHLKKNFSVTYLPVSIQMKWHHSSLHLPKRFSKDNLG